jgi:shikimate kinase
MPTLWLIGFRGTGKTTVGQRLAAGTGLHFVDTDRRIQDMEKMTLAELFATKGEMHFRIAEQQVVLQLAMAKNLVVAVGGGACAREANRIAMRKSGLVILLTAATDEIERRLAADAATADQRPPLTNQPSSREEIVFLLHEREPDYRKTAHIEIDTTFLTPDEVVSAILKEVRHRK